MSVVWTAFAVVMYLGLLVAHEAGHAIALRRLGIPISEAGLGLPFAPRIVLKPTSRRPFALSVSIWLLAAYVEPDPTHDDRLKALSYRDTAWYTGAGVVVNAVIGTGLVSVIDAVYGRWLPAVIWCGVTVVLWTARRWVTAYIIPALAIPVVVVVAWSIVVSIGAPVGPVGIAQLLYVSSAMAAVKIVAEISLLLAIVNTAPIYPFDGGRICAEVIQRWFGARGQQIFQGVGVVLTVTLLAYSVLSDIGWLAFAR